MNVCFGPLIWCGLFFASFVFVCHASMHLNICIIYIYIKFIHAFVDLVISQFDDLFDYV